MRFLLYIILCSNLIPSYFFRDVSNFTKVKIELSELYEIEELVNLGLKADGYIVENKYWLIDLSKQGLNLIETKGLNYERIEEKSMIGIEKYLSYLTGEIKTTFNSCGYQLTISYNQAKKLSFINVQVLDLAGNRYGNRLGYNIPPGNYDCKFNSHNWPDNIYLVQLETSKKEKISKIIRKNISIKKL